MDKTAEHSFSVELKSKDYVKHISLSSNGGDSVLLEGFLGKLEKVSLVEDLLLEIKCLNGVLRIDMKKGELEHFIKLNYHMTK